MMRIATCAIILIATAILTNVAHADISYLCGKAKSGVFPVQLRLNTSGEMFMIGGIQTEGKVTIRQLKENGKPDVVVEDARVDGVVDSYEFDFTDLDLKISRIQNGKSQVTAAMGCISRDEVLNRLIKELAGLANKPLDSIEPTLAMKAFANNQSKTEAVRDLVREKFCVNIGKADAKKIVTISDLSKFIDSENPDGRCG